MERIPTRESSVHDSSPTSRTSRSGMRDVMRARAVPLVVLSVGDSLGHTGTRWPRLPLLGWPGPDATQYLIGFAVWVWISTHLVLYGTVPPHGDWRLVALGDDFSAPAGPRVITRRPKTQSPNFTCNN